MAYCDCQMCDMKNRRHSTQEQLDAFKRVIHYEHFGCFYPNSEEEGYIDDFNGFK